MNFRTRLDITNRQVKQLEKTDVALSGSSSFGLPFSGLTVGPDPSVSGISETVINISSTFSGNTGTTVFTFGDSRMDLAASIFSPITTVNSATTQESGYVWTGNTSQTLDGNFSYLDYSGVSFDFQVTAMTETSPGIFTGSCFSTDVFILSAGTLDFTDRTIWVDVPEILRTNKLIVTNGAIAGQVLTAGNNEGDIIYTPVSAITSGDTYTTGGTFSDVSESINFSGNGVSASFSVDVSELLDNIYVTASTFNNDTLLLTRSDNVVLSATSNPINLGNSDLTIDSSGRRKIIHYGATVGDKVSIRNSGDTFSLVDFSADGSFSFVEDGGTTYFTSNSTELINAAQLNVGNLGTVTQYAFNVYGRVANAGVASFKNTSSQTIVDFRQISNGGTMGISDGSSTNIFLRSNGNSYFIGGNKLGIGTTTPSYLLHVTGDTNVDGVISSGGTDLYDIFSTVDANYYATGFTYNNSNEFTISVNDGNDYKATINTMSGLTIDAGITGETLTVNGGSVFSGETDVVHIYGSGTTQPIFTVEGSSGELFAITDSLTGTLMTVNDISGLPILEVIDDSTVLLGSYLAPTLNTTTKVTVTGGTLPLYTLPDNSYTSCFFDYTVQSDTAGRGGNIMAMWSGSTVQFTETTTSDIGATTSAVTMSVTSTTGGTATLNVSASTGTWTVKTIIRSI